jgi:hypothetical protein
MPAAALLQGLPGDSGAAPATKAGVDVDVWLEAGVGGLVPAAAAAVCTAVGALLKLALQLE